MSTDKPAPNSLAPPHSSLPVQFVADAAGPAPIAVPLYTSPAPFSLDVGESEFELQCSAISLDGTLGPLLVSHILAIVSLTTLSFVLTFTYDSKLHLVFLHLSYLTPFSSSDSAAPGHVWLNIGILHILLLPASAAGSLNIVADVPEANAPLDPVIAAASGQLSEEMGVAEGQNAKDAAGVASAIVHLRCVTQVSKSGIAGDYYRTIFNPLPVSQ